MVSKLHSAAFVSSNIESFSNPMWAILTRLEGYARNENDFASTCIEVCRFLKKNRRYLSSQQEKGDCHANYVNSIVILFLRMNEGSDY
jgi:hypothetical protein